MIPHQDFLTSRKFDFTKSPESSYGVYLDTIEENIKERYGIDFKLNTEQKSLQELLLHTVENTKFRSENPDVRWSILLLGSVGNGKTTLAASTVNYYNSFDRFHKYDFACYCTVNGLVYEIKQTYKPRAKYTEADAIDFYSKCSLLVIDELKTKMSEYECSLLEEIIYQRESRHLPLILIGNLTIEQLAENFDGHIVDRLKTGVIKGFSHKSYRQRG